MHSALSRIMFTLLCPLLLQSASSVAQTFPTRTMRVVVPFQAGGSTDVVFRLLAPRLSEQLGQQVLVDNRPGGGATIGMDIVAKSPPDGHTLGVATVSFVSNPFILSKLPFDTEKDLVPVSLVTRVPHVLTVHPSVPARSVKELIALAKARPGSLLYATAGNASSNHLATELFAYMAGVKLVHVPYKGAGSALTSMLSGETAMMVATLASAVQHFKTGRLIPLGISTIARDSTLPNVPTVAEAGVPGYEVFEWQGVVVPTGTPAPVITRLHQEIVKALAVPEVRERIVGVGARPVGSTPAELGAHIKKELAIWSKVVKAAGVRVD
jgi:tripartite-type tricarboxylate transporter receptor subunit TctC